MTSIATQTTQSKKTTIIYLLDESGSMYFQMNDTLGTRNHCIKEMKEMKVEGEEEEPSFIYYTFSNNLSEELVYENLSDINVTELKYRPEGSTSLLDSMGKIMTKYKDKNDVIIFIFTDGEENTSNRYSYSNIKEMTNEYKEKKSWQFKFIGANIDAFKVAASLGIDRGNVTQSSHSTPLHPSMTRGISSTLHFAREQSVANIRTNSSPSRLYDSNSLIVNANGIGFNNNDTIERKPHNSVPRLDLDPLDLADNNDILHNPLPTTPPRLFPRQTTRHPSEL
mgnify:CR=1 FL=1